MSETMFPELGVWLTVQCTDARLRGLYRRHYSSKKNRREGMALESPNQERICGPGEPLSLLTPRCDAGFNWLLSDFPKAGQEGIECTFYRNESGRSCLNQTHDHCSSRQIIEAVRLAWAKWPGARLFTFVDPEEVHSANPGYCFKRAGWQLCGRSKDGLHILELTPTQQAPTP